MCLGVDIQRDSSADELENGARKNGGSFGKEREAYLGGGGLRAGASLLLEPVLFSLSVLAAPAALLFALCRALAGHNALVLLRFAFCRTCRPLLA
jgi:hypothetical protein